MFLTPQARIDSYTAKGWWGHLTVDDLLQRNRAEIGAQMALIDPANRLALDGHAPRRLTWAELGDEVDRYAAALLASGLNKDDIICAQPPNLVEGVVLVLACARIGLILSPVVMQYRHHELDYILDLLKPAAFVTVAQFAGHQHAQMGLEITSPALPFKVMTLTGHAPEGAIDLAALAAKSDISAVEAYRAAHPLKSGEVFTVCWTSGTESRPKGVPRDHNHWIVNGKVVTEAADLQEGEIILNPFPLVTIAALGIAMAWMWRRGTMVLHHPFDLSVFLHQIAQEKVNYTIAPPAILNMLLKNKALQDQTDLRTVRAIGSGSAPLSPWMIEGFLREHNIQVCNIFGSNEGASLFSGPTHVPDPTDRARFFPRFGADGVDWDGETARIIRTRIVDIATEQDITRPGQAGELRIDGASTISSYFRSPQLDSAAFDSRGFFKTGDLFEIAGEGELAKYYRFVGRCKDIIVRGGVNISPAEIDDLLTGLPQVKEAAVIGLPDEMLGERMCLVVVPNGAAPSLADAKAWLEKSGLAVFKLPERIVAVDALPRNAMNKVMRTELRDQVLAMLATGGGG
jgi:acyl-CoA synthetase (AMP-forming)/AMP-acid ligase II